MTFTAVHVVAVLSDTFVAFALADVLVPMRSAWRPGAIAWGVVAMYLLVAVDLSSRLRRYVPDRAWRSVHTAGFGLFVSATVHAGQAGTDATNPVALGLAASLIVTILGLSYWRIRYRRVPGRELVTPRPTSRSARCSR